MPKNWFPLESNPDVMNDYMGRLGLNVAKYSYEDVVSLEDWGLEMVPQPVYALLLLFPITEPEEEFRRVQHDAILANGQELSPRVYYMKQTIGNACGTIGLLHSVGNGRLAARDLIVEDSHLERLVNATMTLGPDQIAEYLEGDDTLEEVHEAAAEQGQSAVANDVNTHFICFA
jgi:ubiquitin carboxyl-terminal hydrolase L3